MGEAVTGMDRLPWLPEDVPPPAKRTSSMPPGAVGLFAAALIAILALAIVPLLRDERERAEPKPVTVKLPDAKPVVAEPVAATASLPKPASAPAPDRKAPPVILTTKAPSFPSEKPAPPVPPMRATQKPPPQLSQPAGRVVEIGAFGSTEQALAGRRVALSAYPGMVDLPTKVTAARNSKGVLYYRFRFDTTSQAHSEVLCQRMQKIQLSCSVLGLPPARASR